MDARVGSWMCERTLINWRGKLGSVLRGCRHGGNRRRSPILSCCGLQWVSVSLTCHEPVSWYCTAVVHLWRGWRQGEFPSCSLSREGDPISEASRQRTWLCLAGCSALLFSEGGPLTANRGTGVFRWFFGCFSDHSWKETRKYYHVDQLQIRQ